MTSINRRSFLSLAGAGAAGVLAACSDHSSHRASPTAGASPSTDTSSISTSTSSTGPVMIAKRGDASVRRLVIVELSGGNDGMSTVVPHGIGAYHELRTRTAVADDQLIDLDGKLALPKSLKGLHSRGVALLQGVGSPKPDRSHFAMMERWWRGDVNGDSNLPTGFLGRLADAVGDPAAAVVALSLGSGSHPALVSQKASTLSIPSVDSGGDLVGANPDDKARRAFQDAFAEMMQPGGDEPGLLPAARHGGHGAVAVATTLTRLGEDKGGPDYPGSPLGRGLRLTARLLAHDRGLRVVHVPMQRDFDTHEHHPGRHPELLADLDTSLSAFLDDLARLGLADAVLVATTSEFGRSPKDNASAGLDHGTASVALLAGPVKAGLHGEHPSLTTFDDDEQLVATVGFDAYYATLAEWLGVPAADVLPGRVSPIAGVLR